MDAFSRDVVDLSSGLENVPILIEKNVVSSTIPQFQYSPENVQGPGWAVDPSEVTLPGCSCVSHSCVLESCSCLQTHGQAYHQGRLLVQHTDLYVTPVFECNALCLCGDSCYNRVVQVGVRHKVEIFWTTNRGWGVRTLEPIHCGAFVCEYAGEVIGFEEARRRQLAQGPKDSNYIIAVREHAGTENVTETFIDPAEIGNVGRFLNHSCLPNLFMVPVRVHSVVPKLALFAGRDIKAKEELTFDYSGEYRGFCNPQGPCSNLTDPIEASGTDGLQKKICYCGMKNCTGFLPLDISILR
ncbi:LOW QUALITY PROTEIN: histone-lysine N-methyltransferase SETMAR [Boleophthalmus pectinirostris]|uniref:LOW QUALITY PROTEIN: histone-lysine N-methyltransferase SETMAR n=1 Tax=Boleophthalmus pectinirostris TaxID=150288 RepID=UPI00242FBD4B|nr:LOW QUALITY PROTEIN: histone-lysine N-methyltransferase SETMAR [Boleophthalmus pectinirostris]